MGKLDGKVALITGGTTGIGWATARLFIAEGARVVLTGQDADRLTEARANLPDSALALRADVTRVADLAALADRVREEHGRLDVLFANAGQAVFAPAEQLDEATFDRLMAVNVKGVFFTVQQLGPLLRPGASVILNASGMGHQGWAGSTVYAASKAAVRALARTLAAELAPRGIRVNALSPGPVETPIYGKLGMPPEALQAVGEAILQRLALKRFADPAEVARAALFLSCEDASFMTGAELAVDGGMAQL